MGCDARGEEHVSFLIGPPRGFSVSVDSKGFQVLRFGSADYKGVSGAFSVSADYKRLSDL
jgi:hypothetical protein